MKFGWTHNKRLGTLATVADVKYFTHVTQRRLGWATVDVQRKDVGAAEQAKKKGIDSDERGG